MWPLPESDCWLHPAAEVRLSPVAGEGLFASTLIRAGTAVSRLGGRLVTGAELRRILHRVQHCDGGYVDTITVAEDAHLVLPAGQANGKGNHSCDPNLWWAAPYMLVARRDIPAGEELTNDYSTSTGERDFVMPCHCGTTQCRGIATGGDWKRPELQERYGDHWVPGLLSQIRERNQTE
jgi:SET domain-containing protein